MALRRSLAGGPGRERLDRDGWSIRAPGLHGTVVVSRPMERAPGTRSPERPSPLLEEALERAGMEELASVEVGTERVERPVGGGSLRTARGGDALELEVPELSGAGQVVLLADESGTLSWHLPADSPAWPEEARVSRGAGQGLTFRIPIDPAPRSPEGEGRTRSLVGMVGKKVLKVLVYPLVRDAVAGGISAAVRAWEDGARPHRLRFVTPDDYGSEGGRPVEASDWSTLREGRILVLVHGTFSTVHGGFGGMERSLVDALHQAYDGRVVGFDHPTLSRSPADNAAWLLTEGIPDGAPPSLDLLCHSRGGLVARALGQRPSDFGLDTDRVQLDRTVFVGVPNGGTVLAEPDHVVGMLDRYTNLVSLAVPGALGDILDGVLTVVKVVGRGGLDSLAGLMAMRPDGDFLRRLSTGEASGRYFAVSAEFEPTDAGLKRLVQGAADRVVDHLFDDRPNDLVVPEDGVWAENGAPGFPVAGEGLLRLGAEVGALHTTLLSHPRVGGALRGWLPGARS